MSNKEKYRKHCNSAIVPLFSKPWWLDAVCGEANWDVIVVEKNGSIVASMPYHRSKGWFFTHVGAPPLTPILGPWYSYPEGQLHCHRLAQEKKLSYVLIDRIPKCDYFCQYFHYEVTNWLPFFWRGFSQTTGYTYLLTDLTDLDKIWLHMRHSVRTNIRKAIGRFKLTVRADLGIDDFLSVYERAVREGGYPPVAESRVIRRVDSACEERDARRILCAIDSDSRIHAVTYIVWDELSAYCLISSRNSQCLPSSGALSLLLWEAIKLAATRTQRFDFDGAMLESVEGFFRDFGAKQVGYHRVSRMSRRMKFYTSSLELLRLLFRRDP
jgi:hypothetical protein